MDLKFTLSSPFEKPLFDHVAIPKSAGFPPLFLLKATCLAFSLELRTVVFVPKVCDGDYNLSCMSRRSSWRFISAGKNSVLA